MSTCLSSKDGVKARKTKRCCLCGTLIQPGELKDTRTGVDGDGFWTMHMHPECHAYEKVPGTVDSDWYEDVCCPAFDRADALAHVSKQKLRPW